MGIVRNFLLYSFRCVGLVKTISGKVGPAPEKTMSSDPEKAARDAEANGTVTVPEVVALGLSGMVPTPPGPNSLLAPGTVNEMNYADIDFKNMPTVPAKHPRDGDNKGDKQDDLTSMYATILPKHMRPNKGVPEAPSDAAPTDRKRMAMYDPDAEDAEKEPSTPPLPERTEDAKDTSIPEVTTTPPDDLDDMDDDFNPNYARIDLKDLIGLKLGGDGGGGRRNKPESCTDSISTDEAEEEGASAAPDTFDTPSQSPGQQKRHTYVNIKPDGHSYVNVEPKKANREPKGVLFYAVTDYNPMQMHRQGIALKAGDVVEVYSFDQDFCFVVSYPKSCSKPIEGWVPRHILREMGTQCCVPTSTAAEDPLPNIESLNLSASPNRSPNATRDPSPIGRTGPEEQPARPQRDTSPKGLSTIAPSHSIGLEQRKSGSCENISAYDTSASPYFNKIQRWDSSPSGSAQPSPPTPRKYLGGDQSPWGQRKFAPPSPPPMMAPLSSGATPHCAPESSLATVVAVCDYTATLEGCISCHKGEHGQLLDVNSRGWWYVRVGMVEGWVPGDYWEVVKHSQPRVTTGHRAFRGPRYFGFETEPWYHGRLSRHEAEGRLLRYARSRDFLVRQSTHRVGDFVLSVLFCDKIHHFTIETTVDGRFFIGKHYFKEMVSIVCYYQHNTLFFSDDKEPISLGQPLIIPCRDF